MMHNLTRRLILQHTAVLLLFALAVGALFAGVFTRHSTQIHAEDLKAHAIAIADTVTQFAKSNAESECKGGGFNAYFRYIANAAQSDIWLLDQNLTPMRLGEQSSFLTQLPEAFVPYIHEVFEADDLCLFSSGNSRDLSDMIVGVPVHDAQGQPLYVLLLRHSINGITRTYHDALRILTLSLLWAFALSALLSMLLSRRFMTPIYRMKDATLRMMDGHYDTSTGVFQKDELGMLAGHIDKLSARLLDAQKAQADMEVSRREFFSNISHELRTPISVLKGSLEVLEGGMIDDPGEQKAYLTQMLADANHMERLVGDLLELSRLQDSHFSIAMEPINLIDVAQETARFMRQRAREKGVTLTLSGDLDPFCAMGDYGRLRQMLIILLDNAVKFSPRDSAVRIDVTRRSDSCAVAISDCGPGIVPEDIARIFDRFYHRASPDNRSGSGLGLPIAREIALRHGVTIECESRLGEGACFTVVFPAHAG